MDIVEDVMPPDEATNPGGGGARHSSLDSSITTPIYTVIAQKPNKFALTFHKTYHFIMDSSLPAYFKSDAKSEFIYFNPGGCHEFPWNRLFCYVSPRDVTYTVYRGCS